MIRKRSKTYIQKTKLIDKNKEYDLDSAVNLLKQISYTNFDGTVELHINLNLDPKKGNQKLNATVTLPHGTGKKRKILALAKGEAANKAKAAGAEIVGDKNLIEKISQGFQDFDVVVATPEMMSEVVKIAKILGPKGLMPNPKTGTVTAEIDKAIKRLQKGQISLRTEKESVIHTAVGKCSQKENEIIENIKTILKKIKDSKPSKIKGTFIKSAYLSTTMSPAIKLRVEL